jgi:hypothetical protein
MLGLEAAMAITVAIYYLWPAGAAVISAFGSWLHAWGVIGTAVATMVAGGMLSEASLVYIQNHGRWSREHIDRMLFNSVMFFISGVMVYEFYHMQARIFGDSANWRVVLPKVLLDQFGFTAFWSTPYQALMTRWQTLHFSGSKLRRELGWGFVLERMLPILLTNWIYWFPCVALIYSLPLMLQPSLFLFATAAWGLLMPAVARQEREGLVAPVPILSGSEVLPEPSE